MERKKVAVFDQYLDMTDSWRNLFFQALKRKSDVIMVKFFSDLFHFDGKLDVLVCMMRQKKNFFEDALLSFGKHFNARLVVIGGEAEGFIPVNQMDFSSEDDFIKAIIR